MEEEKESSIWYKVVPNHKYRVWRKDYNGSTFYNIMVQQKQYDNQVKKYYIPITFKKGIEVANETDIKIIKAIENIRENKHVDEKNRAYYPVFSYMITEFETLENEEQVIQNAYDDFRDNLDAIESEDGIDNLELPF